MTPPKRFGSKAQPVHAWAVYIIEPKPDESVDSPIEWLLITTVPTKSFKDARQRVEWYTKRWGIEVYHRTLKSDCRIKDRQLGDADRIETCLAIDMVVAWRIFHLTMLGRENPEAPCTIFFQDQEWQALCCYTSKKPVPPAEPPTLKEAIRMVGAMGGHLGRKHDGPQALKHFGEDYNVWIPQQRCIPSLPAKMTLPNAHSRLSAPPVLCVYNDQGDAVFGAEMGNFHTIWDVTCSLLDRHSLTHSAYLWHYLAQTKSTPTKGILFNIPLWNMSPFPRVNQV